MKSANEIVSVVYYSDHQNSEVGATHCTVLHQMTVIIIIYQLIFVADLHYLAVSTCRYEAVYEHAFCDRCNESSSFVEGEEFLT